MFSHSAQLPAHPAPPVEVFLRSVSPFHGLLETCSGCFWSCPDSVMDSPHLSGPDHRICETEGSRTSKTPRLCIKESPGALSKERNPMALRLLKQGLRKQQLVLGICLTSSGKLGYFHHMISIKSLLLLITFHDSAFSQE